MTLATTTPDEMLNLAVAAVRQGREMAEVVLNDFPVPVYTTDAEGRITWFNRACIDFSGRMPVVGEDRWCVTWKLYAEDGTAMPHDQCPMALAIRQMRIVRGTSAIAERPDGSKVPFVPYPVLLHDDDGHMVGALNLFVEIDRDEQANSYRTQATRCRRLALSMNEPGTIATLKTMADEYDDKARGLDRLN